MNSRKVKSKEPSRSLFKSITYTSGSLLLDGVNAVTPHWAGAVDVVAVRQPDGTLKSSPFYVRFGKYQSIIRRNRHVAIEVNGTVMPFTMNLGSLGQAYFVREVEELCSDSDDDGGLAEAVSPASTYGDSGDDSYFKDMRPPVLGGPGDGRASSAFSGASPPSTELMEKAKSAEQNATAAARRASLLASSVTSQSANGSSATSTTAAAAAAARPLWHSVDRSSSAVSAPSVIQASEGALDAAASTTRLPMQRSAFLASGASPTASMTSSQSSHPGAGAHTTSSHARASGLDAALDLAGSRDGAQLASESIGSSSFPAEAASAEPPLVVVGFGVRGAESDKAADGEDVALVEATLSCPSELPAIGGSCTEQTAGPEAAIDPFDREPSFSVDVDARNGSGALQADDDSFPWSRRSLLPYVRVDITPVTASGLDVRVTFSLDEFVSATSRAWRSSNSLLNGSIAPLRSQAQKDGLGPALPRVAEADAAADVPELAPVQVPQHRTQSAPDGSSPDGSTSPPATPKHCSHAAVDPQSRSQSFPPNGSAARQGASPAGAANGSAARLGETGSLAASSSANSKALPLPITPSRSSPARERTTDGADGNRALFGSSPGAMTSRAGGQLPMADILRLFALSLCGHLLNDEMSPAAVSELFNTHMVTADAFTADASSILASPDLVFRVEDRVYRYADALPVLIGILAFRDSNTWEQLQPAQWWQATIPTDSKKPAKRSWWAFWSSAATEDNNGKSPRLAVDGQTLSPANSGHAPQLSSTRAMSPLQLLHTATFIEGASDDERRIRKRKVVVKTSQPTQEELATMAEYLHDGQNTISFVIGSQRVTSLIFLFEWNIRLIISDIDGTITRSDVLGHVLPNLGYDWSHVGIASLFTNICANGYSFVFLSSRSIAQSNITRNFLGRLKQELDCMPNGPVIISPHGILPSLYREMILKRPQEFKIEALQAIRDLFPDEWNPFYAGFGNRDTDEISYLEVGVPASRIFTINPKGQVSQKTAPVQSGTFDSLRKINSQVDVLFPTTSAARQSQCMISAQGDAAGIALEGVPAVPAQPRVSVVDVEEREEYNDSHFWRIPASESLDSELDLAVPGSGAPTLGMEQRAGKPATTKAAGGPILGASTHEKRVPGAKFGFHISVVGGFESGDGRSEGGEAGAQRSASMDAVPNGSRLEGDHKLRDEAGDASNLAIVDEDSDVFDDAEDDLVYSPYSPI